MTEEQRQVLADFIFELAEASVTAGDRRLEIVALNGLSLLGGGVFIETVTEEQREALLAYRDSVISAGKKAVRP